MQPWQKLDERPLYDGYRKIVGRTYLLPDGREHLFDVKDEAPTVVVVALTSANDVVLTREFRPGPEEVLLELPGGAIDDGETPAQAIERELLEETGYRGDLRYVGAMVDCAYSTRVRHTFAGTACSSVAAPTPQSGEHIEVVLMPVPQFREHLRRGRLTDVGPGYLALDFLDLL